ncbi:hypothetical protein S40293_00182 [Stachybotrys chartarum IBT 40293]|nr:hypothetical protein S40293_00182 [Stachybotrys chartarum IBT 40293]
MSSHQESLPLHHHDIPSQHLLTRQQNDRFSCTKVPPESRHWSGLAMINRPSIARRSCDQCRARKIGCDRAHPCSNCVTGRVECTHSAVASTVKPTTPKQRVLISAQYERKIDDIARDIDGIKTLLQNLDVRKDLPAPPPPPPPPPPPQINTFTPSSSAYEQGTPLNGYPSAPPPTTVPRWDHSAHVVDFLNALVYDQSLPRARPESSQVLSSLENLATALEYSDVTHSWARVDTRAAEGEDVEMPPQTAVVDIIRWAKAHEHHSRLQWIVKTLSLDKFEEICCKVYFPVKGHTDAEYIITCSFLAYVFAEHATIYGNSLSAEYCQRCRALLGRALLRLSLYLPASMEMVVALTQGALYSIEESRASRAWTLISSALSMCQTLGYHRLNPKDSQDSAQQAKQRLFWAVYSYENSIALRLGRSSGIRDSDITLPRQPGEPRYLHVSRIQRQVWDRLYSPAGLATPAHERGLVVQDLAGQLRAVLEDVYAEMSALLPTEAVGRAGDPETDPMRIVYLQCDLVCNLSLLTLVLRAVPMPMGEPWQVSHECVEVARNTFEVHQQCIRSIHACRDPLIAKKYISWAILQTPFVPFSILFSRAVHLSDGDDLGRLETFAASLEPAEASEGAAPTHPHRLYDLLCQAARLRMDASTMASSQLSTDRSTSSKLPVASPGASLAGHDAPGCVATAGPAFAGSDDAAPAPDMHMDMPLLEGVDGTSLGNWYYGNQQLMCFLDEDCFF